MLFIYRVLGTRIQHAPTINPVASLQCIRITNSSSNPPLPSSSSSSTASAFRFSASKRSGFTIRCSQADGPLRRPSIAAPPVRPAPPSKPTQPNPPPPVSSSPETAATGQNVVTMEFQRQKAKELQEYFKQKKLEEANQGPFFGFIAKNEISNGRWAMFGFGVGILTEYATGSVNPDGSGDGGRFGPATVGVFCLLS